MPIIKNFLFLISLLYTVAAFAQEIPKPVLNSDDVGQFIKSYKPLIADLEALYAKNSKDLNKASLALMKSASSVNEEVRTVLKKYGWDEDFTEKFSVIIMSYKYINMEKEMNIDDMLNEQKPISRRLLDQSAVQYKSIVNEKDINLVRGKFDALKKMIESI